MEEFNILQIHDLMKQGNLTSRELVIQFQERIEKIDKNGPKLNSVIELNPDAIKIAEKLDNEWKQNQIRGPLH